MTPGSNNSAQAGAAASLVFIAIVLAAGFISGLPI